MKESLEEFSFGEGPKQGLFVLELPTGYGKSYEATSLIYQYLKEEKGRDIKHVFYLTPKKKNLHDAYSDLKKRIDEAKDSKELLNQVLIIKANADEVIENLPKWKNPPSTISSKSSYQDLKKAISAYNQVKAAGVGIEALNDSRKRVQDFERVFRNDLENMIKKEWEEKTPDQRLLRIKKEMPGLIDLYPAIETHRKKVIFTTVDKFFYRNNPIITNSYSFINSKIIEDSLIIIDELDEAGKTLLKAQIEKCTQDKVNLLYLINRLYHSINRDDVPEGLFDQLKSEDKADGQNESDNEKTTRSAFGKLKKVINSCYEEHHLNKQFKLDADKDCDSFFLFHDYSTTTVFQNGHKNIFIQENVKKGINEICFEENDKTDKLTSLLGSVSGAYSYFIKFIAIASKNYLTYYNKMNKMKPIEYEDAVTSVIGAFFLDDDIVYALKNRVLNDHRKHETNQKKNLLGYDLYQEGFMHYSFTNDDSHVFSTKLNCCFLDDTPEKYLVDLCRKARVVGLSATAQTKSVIGNFNLGYLKEQLQDTYCTPSMEYIEKVKKGYEERAKQCKIYANDIRLPEKEPVSVFGCPPFEEWFAGQFDEQDENKDFYYRRLISVTSAMISFIDSPSSKVLLLMTNPLLRNDRLGPYTEKNIHGIIEEYCRIKNISHIPELIVMDSANYAEVKEKIPAKLKEKGKVILATSYNTAGTGQNLCYEQEEEGELKSYDIDSIYLEKPTYLLNMVQTDSKEADLVTYVFQILALRNNSEIDYKFANSTICKAYREVNKTKGRGSGLPNSELYHCDSVNNYGIAVIKQAIGRMNRNKNKRDAHHVYFEHSIVSDFDFSDEKDKLQIPEFEALMKCGQKLQSPDKETTKRITAAKNHIHSSYLIYHKLMNLKDGAWATRYMEQWDELRKFVLENPTCSEETMSKQPELKSLYLQALPGQKINRYFYKTEKDKETLDQPICELSYEKLPGYKEISEQSVKLKELVQCKYVSNYFRDYRHFPCSFEPNDYILLPNIMRDIYQGALGEEAGKGLLENKEEIILEPIDDPKKFEKADFWLKEDHDIYFDFKNWSENTAMDDHEMCEKCLMKLKEMKGKALFVINLLAKTEHPCYSYPEKNPRVFVIPSLLAVSATTGKIFTHDGNLALVKKLIKEAMKYGNEDKDE